MRREASAFDPRHTYAVEARRSGRWWALTVPELPGVHSQVRRLEQSAAMIRDAIGLAFDIPPESVTVTEPVPVLGSGLDELLNTTRASRERLVELRVEVDVLTRRLAREMAEAGVPVRDIATVLGVSFQHAATQARRAS